MMPFIGAACVSVGRMFSHLLHDTVEVHEKGFLNLKCLVWLAAEVVVACHVVHDPGC